MFIFRLFMLACITAAMYAFIDCVILDWMLSDYIKDKVEEKLYWKKD